MAEEALTVARQLGDALTIATAELDAGVALWNIPTRRPETFAHFDEALRIIRELIATDDGMMLQLDGQQAKADALAGEASHVSLLIEAQTRTP